MEEFKERNAPYITTTQPLPEVIILAGGLGTRLQNTVPDLPKVLAPVGGRAFLSYLIDYLRMQGLTRFVFALGYRSEKVLQFLRERYSTLDFDYTVEGEPLGTGGAIRLALQKIKTEQVLIVNGDTLFKIDFAPFWHFHQASGAECTLALKDGEQAGRYGRVQLDPQNRITAFREANCEEISLINGGIYLLQKTGFFLRSFPHHFSFENDYLAAFSTSGNFYGWKDDGYFIDIGVPADYQKAQTDLQPPVLHLDKVDNSWTLFIDRDGVINEETVGEYILHWDQFIFSKGVLQSFKQLSECFGRIFLVTNQKGVGRGLMKQEALDTIHYEMQREIEIVGGHLDKIYACTAVENTSFNRKPNPGMALQAKQDFPEIDLAKSIMVGNKPSDMQFGRAAGMFTVFIATTNPDEPYPHPDVDLRFSTLADFAAHCQHSRDQVQK